MENYNQNVRPALLFELSKKDTVFAILAIIISVFASIFGIFGGFALGYTITVFFMLTLFTVYFAKQGSLDFLSVIFGILSLANGAVFITTQNSSVRFFAVIISFLSALMFLGGLVFKSIKGNRQACGIYYSTLSTVGNIGISLKSLFYGKSGDKKTVGKVFLGLACALPVLIIVVPLLISSDQAFRGLMTHIFSNTFSTILKSAFGFLISLFVISYGFSLKFNSFAVPPKAKPRGVENVYLISFLSAIAVCYFLYLFSQLAYFFSAFRGFLPNGEITFSEYARKGFFEMCAIAIINLFIVFITLIISKKRKGKACHTIKALATFICLFTLIIISTAISKMVLYIGEYGMTVKRLTTSSFMVFLAVVFIAIGFKIFIRKINILKTALLAAGIVVLLLGTFNVNSVCAKYNYENYKNGTLKEIDVNAIYNLGDEGVPYLVKLAYDKNTDTALSAQNYLYNIYTKSYSKYFSYKEDFCDPTLEDLKQNQKYTQYSTYSIPKAHAYKNLYKFIEANPDFCSDYREYLEIEQAENNFPPSYY